MNEMAQTIADMLNTWVGRTHTFTADQVYALAWAMAQDEAIQDQLTDLAYEIRAEDIRAHAGA